MVCASARDGKSKTATSRRAGRRFKILPGGVVPVFLGEGENAQGKVLLAVGGGQVVPPSLCVLGHIHIKDIIFVCSGHLDFRFVELGGLFQFSLDAVDKGSPENVHIVVRLGVEDVTGSAAYHRDLVSVYDQLVFLVLMLCPVESELHGKLFGRTDEIHLALALHVLFHPLHSLYLGAGGDYGLVGLVLFLDVCHDFFLALRQSGCACQKAAGKYSDK